MNLFFFGCAYDPAQKVIEVENNTDSAIYVAFSLNDTLQVNQKLSLFEIEYYNNAKHILSPNYRVNAHLIGGIGTPGRESLLNKSKDRKIRLFVIKEVTIRNNSWEKICEKKMYEEKIVLSVYQLKKLDWRLSYPSVQRNKKQTY